MERATIGTLLAQDSVLQPGRLDPVVMTRWAEDDLTGRLLKAQTEPKADTWKQVSFPAILDSGNPVWPEYWELDELEKIKASIPIRNWSAQYMQNPTQKKVLFSNEMVATVGRGPST